MRSPQADSAAEWATTGRQPGVDSQALFVGGDTGNRA